MKIVFKDPPPPRGGIPHQEIARALRGRPGKWAVVHSSQEHNPAAQVAQAIKAARSPVYKPAGSFEAVVRTDDQGNRNVYARYVGGES